jgi:hypothetical protein
MRESVLAEDVTSALNICNSHNQMKRVYSKLYHFCKENRKLPLNDFYGKINFSNFNPLRKDYKNSTNPDFSKKGEQLYLTLRDELSDVFSLGGLEVKADDKLEEWKRRELATIVIFYEKNG